MIEPKDQVDTIYGDIAYIVRVVYLLLEQTYTQHGIGQGGGHRIAGSWPLIPG